ncbi:MAG: sugar phosphate isomerase/epimerase family protein [Desulfobaccales bacterium]|nr:sugar phosphate isomerase/epimerase family protein [Desulfobaccales bacterium]
MAKEIGFMQGRLSPLMDGKIQAFPWPYWRQEFALAAQHGFALMEWTLDQDRLYENPLMTRAGRQEIARLMEQYGVAVKTLTGDCFMQAPFYKAQGQVRQQLLADLQKVVQSCAVVGINKVLLPLVDNGRLENYQQEDDLVQTLSGMAPLLKDAGVQLMFESDYPPERLAAFLGRLPSPYFGLTYDVGNSAALGYQPEEEIDAYGPRILNVHVKDRLRGGGTVPLGEGDANIPTALKALWDAGYKGPYILQTARAQDGDHPGALCRYRDLVRNWLNQVDRHEP